MATSPLDLKRSARWSMPMPPVLQGPGPGFGWGKNPPTGGAGRPNLGGKYRHAAGVFSVQMASKKGGRRAPPCSWTNARMGGSPVEPILVQGMTCAWCVGEGGAPYKSRPKAVPPAKGGLSRARGPRGVVHRGATTCIKGNGNGGNRRKSCGWKEHPRLHFFNILKLCTNKA